MSLSFVINDTKALLEIRFPGKLKTLSRSSNRDSFILFRADVLLISASKLSSSPRPPPSLLSEEIVL